MKKVLSFVLSVAMVICLMPSLAFAADDAATGLSQFSDADSINNKEAVAVLVGLGVIDGMDDGTFQPAGKLTRAQASKLVATVMQRGVKPDSSVLSEDVFTDVPKDHWAAASIKIGVENDYINGMGDGTFHPEEEVTTAQMVTMLEKLLGFAVSDVNYNWPENAMAIAKGGQNSRNVDVDLLTKVKKGAGEALNREEAAQIIFNALLSTDVVKATTTGSGNSDVEGGTGYAAVANKLSDDYRSVPNQDRDTVEQLIEAFFPTASLDNQEEDDFGRTATVWKVGKDKVTDEVIKAPNYTYTSLQTKDSIKADLDGYDLTNVQVRANGNVLGNQDLSSFEPFITFKNGNSGCTGNGTLTEVYLNDKGSAVEKVVVVTYEAAKVTGVNSQKETIDITTESGKESYTIEKSEDEDLYAKISSVAKKDYILVAIGRDRDTGDNVIKDAYIPQVVTGKVTKYVEEKVKEGERTAEPEAVVGGTSYTLASQSSVADTTAIGGDLKLMTGKTDEVKIYLDKYGYIKYNDEVDTERDDYIYVRKVYTDTDKFDEETKYVLGVTENGEVVEDLEIAENTTAPTDLTVIDYRETADGYTFGDNKDGSKSNVQQYTEKISANDTRLGNYYISKDVKTVVISGDKPADLKASVTDGLTNVTKGKGIVYLVVNEDNEVETVFVTKGSVTSDEIIYLTGKAVSTEEYTRDSGKTSTATLVKCYRADSNVEQEIYVKTNPGQGFYSDLEEDGVTEAGDSVYQISAYVNDVNEDIQTTSGTITFAASNGVITVGQESYTINDDNAVRDLTKNQKETGLGKIDSIDSLIDAVKEDVEMSDGTKAIEYQIDVAMVYEITNDGNEVSQLYITNISKLH
jgi:hypothetical protein